ncbi:DUF4123 domain-containing protein [Tautonia marina]|uniref:DUF4123 domain-containing protein n=1 Tax=Tautonia marina TaxID=2653855 RepID=UPI0012610E29|nr:DUF4123 domain-containing protein [Tautonia marina]
MAEVTVILDVLAGPDAPRSFRIEPGATVRIGRADTADFVLTDRSLSRLHFTLSLQDAVVQLLDEVSRFGTFVNGARVTRASLRAGDIIEAGVSRFTVRMLAQRPPAPRPVPAPPKPRHAGPGSQPQTPGPPASALEILRSQPSPLSIILDAARDPLILALLTSCPERHQSLYEGPLADQLVESAPYLVSLPSGSSFLETLVTEGWGKSWGIVLSSSSPFDELRKHLRRFLTVKHEGKGQVLFRFYDPRVLNIFLPTCTPSELREFFGPIQWFLVEGDRVDELRRFGADSSGLRREFITLSTPSNPAERRVVPSEMEWPYR